MKPDRIDVEPETDWLTRIGIAAWIAAFVLLLVALGTINQRITHLQHQVACLEHPAAQRAPCR